MQEHLLKVLAWFELIHSYNFGVSNIFWHSQATSCGRAICQSDLNSQDGCSGLFETTEEGTSVLSVRISKMSFILSQWSAYSFKCSQWIENPPTQDLYY